MACYVCRSEGLGSSISDPGFEEPANGLVMTSRELKVIQSLMPWLQTDTPLLLVGPEGCGKAVLMQYCFNQLVRLT